MTISTPWRSSPVAWTWSPSSSKTYRWPPPRRRRGSCPSAPAARCCTSPSTGCGKRPPSRVWVSPPRCSRRWTRRRCWMPPSDVSGTPAVLKTAGFGYDGKGQVVIRQPAEAGQAWRAIGGGEAVLEAFVDFEREVSVVAARGADGAFVH
ncbi:MAG: ATP-grasp domain-containing protein [Arhodomonas sp.]|nr:ATP-grasp domain-containing protein [Arhodomonas sp.]